MGDNRWEGVFKGWVNEREVSEVRRCFSLVYVKFRIILQACKKS